MTLFDDEWEELTDYFWKQNFSLKDKWAVILMTASLKRIKEFPEEWLDWEYIPRNPNITMKFVIENLGKFYSLYSFSSSPNISVKEILECPFLKNEWIALNPNLTIKDVLNYSGVPLNYTLVSSNRGITMKDILSNPQLPWDPYFITENPNTTMKFILSLSNNVGYFLLSSNPGIKMSDITENPTKLWNWSEISKNPNLTAEFILSNMDKEWDWYNICRNPNITPEEIMTLKPTMIGASMLYKNPNISIEFIKKNPPNYNGWLKIFSKDRYLKRKKIFEKIEIKNLIHIGRVSRIFFDNRVDIGRSSGKKKIYRCFTVI